MPMDAVDIEKMIKEALPDAVVNIRDLAGDGDHYAAEVVSESFRGKTRVQQHQMVYKALQGNMGGALHALALQTSAPEQHCSIRGKMTKKLTTKKTSGLEKIPRFIKSPFYTDQVFWTGLATLIFWIALFYWIFG